MDRIIGKRIVLRKARPDDLEAVYRRVYGDRDVLALMFMPPSPSREEAAARLARTIAYQQGKPVYFAALRDTDEVIGLGGVREEAPGVYAETGLVIGRDQQGKGYGTEMLGLLMDQAFSVCGARAFAYYCVRENARSRRLALRFGFRYDSEAEAARDYDGKHFLVERYLLRRDEYFARREETGREKDSHHGDEDRPV